MYETRHNYVVILEIVRELNKFTNPREFTNYCHVVAELDIELLEIFRLLAQYGQDALESHGMDIEHDNTDAGRLEWARNLLTYSGDLWTLIVDTQDILSRAKRLGIV